MTEINATVRLRPTRIGFLVRPNDLDSIKKIMAYCSCLWGGSYNPIIPVFKTAPKDWRSERFERLKGPAIARGYVNFFEPDVYVEAEEGLAEEVGLSALREKHSFREQVITLSKFMAPRDHKTWSEPYFGLSIVDVYRHLYEKEQRFAFRDKIETLLVEPNSHDGLVEAMFGAFPNYRPAAYIEKGYVDVFSPSKETATVDTWLKVFKKRFRTPLAATKYTLEPRRWGSQELLIYVFNPARPTDLIDLWNIRLEPHPVLPVPIDWVDQAVVVNELRKAIKAEHRPMRGNPQKLKFHATIEFARSINEEKAKSVIDKLRPGLPAGSIAYKLWRNRIWENHRSEFVHRDRRLLVTAKEQNVSLAIKKSHRLTSNFEALSPEFAARYAGHSHRWANVLRCSSLGSDDVATVLPFNTYDRSWPKLGLGLENVAIGTEGLVFSQRFKDNTESMYFLSKEEAIIGTLKQRGIESTLSDPGHIARQMLDHLGGLWGVKIIADLDTIKLLNDMAGTVRRKSNESDQLEETFPLRSSPLEKWTALISKRKQLMWSSHLKLADFTNKKVLRLGLETGCPHCHTDNWHTLTATDYKVTCERCLKEYDFPQAKLREHNRNWTYRVIGPFSVPDFGRGAYSSLLTLRALQGFGLGSNRQMTFSTALEVQFDGKKAEADFVALWRKENHDIDIEPNLVIGETKSLGTGDLIKQKDLSRLKALAAKLPGAVIVISVMRDHFTANEKKLLLPFVRWARRADSDGHAKNPVILLTGHELFTDHDITNTWKQLGGTHKKYSEHHYTNSLESLAISTQAIYLGMPTLHEVREQQWKKRDSRRQKGQAVESQT